MMGSCPYRLGTDGGFVGLLDSVAEEPMAINIQCRQPGS